VRNAVEKNVWVPKELPGVSVNITCINSKCEDIPAYMAVSKFAAEGASE
jgi:hypothetical protein